MAKSGAFILQIILVIGIVMIFAWFDPFNWLSPTKTKLENTPIQIESIKKIGQFITAEYYGETIASLDEVANQENNMALSDISTEITNLHQEFSRAILDLQKSDIKNHNQNALLLFNKSNFDLINETLYEPYLYYIFERIKNRNYKTNDLNKTLNPDQKATLFRRLYGNNYNWYQLFTQITTQNLIHVFKRETVKQSIKKYQKSRLVLVGRGWVKAGFNFENFTARNFIYKRQNKSIYFIGLQPKILSKTINPWFIPEQGVAGFEFVIAEKGGLHHPDYTRKVKKRCLEKLETQALNKQILVQAQQNAEKNLKIFFELLLDTELKAVHFHANYLSYTLSEILNDTLKNSDLITIDSSLLYYYKNYQKLLTDRDLVQFTRKIKNQTITIFNHKYPVDARTAMFYEIIEDYKIDSTDYLKIKNISNKRLLDTLWYAHEISEVQTDTLSSLISHDSTQFFDNLFYFLHQQNNTQLFNDTVLQTLKTTNKNQLHTRLKMLFEPKL